MKYNKVYTPEHNFCGKGYGYHWGAGHGDGMLYSYGDGTGLGDGYTNNKIINVFYQPPSYYPVYQMSIKL